MIYIVAEITKEELPLAVASSLNELAATLTTDVSTVCKIIKYKRTTRLLGTPAKIYKMVED